MVTGDEATRIRDHVRTNVADKSEKIRQKINEEPVMRMIDRLSFTAGLSLLVLAEAMVCARPTHFWLFFVVVIPTLLCARGVYYWYLSWQFFTLE